MGGTTAATGAADAPTREQPQQPPEKLGFKRSLLPPLGRYSAPEELKPFLCSGAILYTASDEDSWSELDALAIGSTDRVLSVTGSGCRSLNLLLAQPEAVVSVDANPLQNYLLELKVAAMRELRHGAFLRFMGVREDPDRLATYARIRGHLSEGAAEFWDMNHRALDAGVLFTGAHEAYYRRIMPMLFAPRRGLVRELFEFTDIAEQRRFYHERWNTLWWRMNIRYGTQSSFYRMVLPDPSYIAHVELDQPVGAYMLNRFEHTLTTALARDNHFLAVVFLGRYHNEQAMPAFLVEEHYEAIRSQLDKLQIVTAPIDAYLAGTPDGSFDAYSLSDISGWTELDQFQQILGDVVRTGRPGARFVYRNFLTKRSIPESLLGSVEPLTDVTERLDQKDLAWVYTFQVGRLAA